MKGPYEEMAGDSLERTYAVFGNFPGYRAAQAKGVLCRGRFISSGEAAKYTSAAHLQPDAVTPVTVRFSNASTDPTHPDGALDVRSMAAAFHLADEARTDILALTMPRFFVGTAEQFLRWQRAMIRVGALPWLGWRYFLYAARRKLPAMVFWRQTRGVGRVPSYATCRYNSLHAFKWATAVGECYVECYVRYSWLPPQEARYRVWQLRWWRAPHREPDYLRADLERRLARGAVCFDLEVQLAAGDDRIDDASAKWGRKRRRVRVGTLELTDMGPCEAMGREPLRFESTRVTEGIELVERDSLLALRRYVYALSAKRRSCVERERHGGPAPPTDTSKTVRVSPEIEICYERFGRDNRRKLLLLMGFACPQTWWQPGFYEQFIERGYEVIRLDNRDCGRSTHLDVEVGQLRGLLFPRWAKAYSIDDMAEDVARLLEKIDVQAAHVVGISMGGMIAQALAINRPERVLSMTCISSAPYFRLRPFWPLRRLRVFARLARRPPEDERAWVDFSVPLWRLLNGGHFLFEEDNVRKLLHRADRWSGGPDPSADFRQTVAVRGSKNRRRALRKLTTPALVIHGTADPLVPFKGGEALRKAIPGARWVQIDGMGHYTPKETWKRVIDGVDELARQAEP